MEPAETFIKEHIVRRFETLPEIALKYDMSLADLRTTNKLNHDGIHPGQRIFVSVQSNSSHKAITPGKQERKLLSHTVKPRETLSTIGLQYGMKVSEISSINHLESSHVEPGQLLDVYQSSFPPPSKRSRSVSTKATTVFSPSDFAAIRVPNGATPHLISTERTIQELADIYHIKATDIIHLNPSVCEPLQRGTIVFVKEIPIHFPVKSVDRIFRELRTKGEKYQYEVPNESEYLMREPCRYLISGCDVSVLGVLSLTKTELLFDPHLKDKKVRKEGIGATTLRMKLLNVYAPTILRESEIEHGGKGLNLDFAVPATRLRYLQVYTLQNPSDEMSDIDLKFFFAIRTQRIEAFFTLFIEAICEEKAKDEGTYVPPDDKNEVVILGGKMQSRRKSCGDTPVMNLFFSEPAPLLSPSDILNDCSKESLVKIRCALPERYRSHCWTKVFSTSEDGTSLRTFYDRTSVWACSILFIEDHKGHIFGAYTSAPWILESEGYYGSGETFLFRIFPHLSLYPWKPKSNDYFMFAKEDHLEIGGGGSPGLWIDEEICNGLSKTCKTFENDCLASSEDFQIAILEVWSFSSDIVLADKC